ncbi:MAG: hypothetical protein AB1705_20955 [Verrucomicrobiota bacterium]
MKTLPSIAVAAAALLAGCATAPPKLLPRTGDPLVDGKTYIAQGPPRDRVLWQYRTATVAMRRGLYDEAKPLLDDALLTIGNIFGKNRDARKSRSYFVEESRKNFIGEPYERVMAYYYRGILYWMDGEPDNARACFRSAQLQDSDTDSKSYANDYVLLEYLDGLASVKLAGDGSDAFERAQSLSKLEAPPPYDAQANVLFFTECGNGPRKYASGQYREQLRFREGAPGAHVVVIKVAGQTLRARAYDDLYFQATTRGGRVMDHVLANKAVFKKGTDTLGDAAIISGAILTQNRETDEIGLGVLAAGLFSKIVAASTTPAADTRDWDNLPRYLSFSTLCLPPGAHTAQVEFLDHGGRLIQSKTISFEVTSTNKDTVVFISDKK